MTRPETIIINKLILTVAQVLGGGVRIFRRFTGDVLSLSGQQFSVSKPGQCDLWGFLRGGLHFEVELKVGKDKNRSKEHPTVVAQAAWRETCQELGVPHLVLCVKNVEDAAAGAAELIAWLQSLSGVAHANEGRGSPPQAQAVTGRRGDNSAMPGLQEGRPPGKRT